MITTIGDHQVRLVRTWEAPAAVIDAWETLDAPVGSVFHTGVVVTVLTGQEASAEPFHGWADVYGYAVVERPDSDPLERFHEALRQAHERHRQRHTEAHFLEG